jgi:hypothetical protein
MLHRHKCNLVCHETHFEHGCYYVHAVSPVISDLGTIIIFSVTLPPASGSSIKCYYCDKFTPKSSCCTLKFAEDAGIAAPYQVTQTMVPENAPPIC